MDNIETIRALSPRYAALLEKDREIATRLDAVLPRGRELTAEKNKHTVPWQSEQRRTKPQPVRRHEGAEALLGELLPPLPEHEINPPPLPESWSGAAELRDVTSEVEALVEARVLLLPIIEKARNEYSKLAAEQRAKDYKNIAEAVVKAAVKLGDALVRHHEYVDRVRLDGIDKKFLRPINLEAFGELHEEHTPLRSLIEDAIYKGHADEKVRPAWRMPAPLPVLSTN